MIIYSIKLHCFAGISANMEQQPKKIAATLYVLLLLEAVRIANGEDFVTKLNVLNVVEFYTW